MKRIPAWRRYLTFWRADIERDVADELAFHAEMRIEECIARGMTEAEARHAVAERLGDVSAAHDECVEWGQIRATHARRASFFDGLRSDVRYAIRSLRRAPVWTTVALLTIALGVGSTTTVFSVADALLVRTLPYPDASRVYLAQRQFTIRGDVVPSGVPFGMAKIWREHAHAIQDAVLAGGDVTETLLVGAESLTVHAMHTEPGFVAFAGGHLVLGNMPRPEEVTSNSHLMLLTEQLWRREFGASPDIVGRVVTLQNENWTIAGVAPATLTVPNFRVQRPDLLQLIAPTEGAPGATVLVRLAPGVSRSAATAELDALMKNANLPDIRPGPMPMELRLTRPEDWLAIRQPLVLLTGAVALLLLVACTNVTHLLLARGAARQRELAIRHALGAGRARLVRQLSTESVLLALVGGLLAVFVGWGGLHVLLALRPTDRIFNALTYVSPNRATIAIASALAIGCGLVVGVIAALHSAHRDLAVDLRVGAASTAYRAGRLRSLLVVGEVAVSATLLVGALLLVHTLFALEHTDLGFDAHGLYGITLSVPRGTQTPDRAAFAAAARDRFAHAPGVSDAIVSDRVPGGRGFTMLAAFETPDHPRSPQDANGGTAIYGVPPEYFATLRMPLLAGRAFDEGSFANHEVIVSRSLANQVARGETPIGLRIRNAVVRSRGSNIVIPGKPATPTPDEPWQTIVGVVPDVMTNLTEGTPTAALYRPLELANQPAGANVTLVVRDDDPNAIARLGQVAASFRRGGPPPTVLDVRAQIDASLMEPRFTMRVLMAFALLGVLLAAIGLFGVISYSVGQRTREIGVRMALGATRSSIARLVIGDGLRLALIGTAIGLAGAVVATRLVQSVLYGVSRFDPIAFVGGAVVLLIVAAIACVAPMLRATTIDPALAVRAD